MLQFSFYRKNIFISLRINPPNLPFCNRQDNITAFDHITEMHTLRRRATIFLMEDFTGAGLFLKQILAVNKQFKLIVVGWNEGNNPMITVSERPQISGESSAIIINVTSFPWETICTLKFVNLGFNEEPSSGKGKRVPRNGRWLHRQHRLFIIL